MQEERIHMVQKKVSPDTSQCMIYWMRCEHRVHNNWALLYALQQANNNKLPLLVLFSLSGSTPNSSYRQQQFLFESIPELQQSLEALDIPFANSNAQAPEELAELIASFTPYLLVTDHSALKPQQHWLDIIKKHTHCSVAEVDGRNIVPVRYASDKQEYAARTIRPKIHRVLEQFLTPFPKLTQPKQVWKGDLRSAPLIPPQGKQNSPSVVPHLKSGETAAGDILSLFLTKKIHHYLHRNDPTKDALSNLSPYLHFGMLSAQQVVLETLDHPQVPAEAKEVFLEELVVRRELADNFCFYNKEYDSTACFPKWAQETLAKHRSDPRDYIYSLQELEQGTTHDPLWNAAQLELLHFGKIHGYMRMYWAKKILEWTATPEDAMHHAIYLNDTYSIDGVDSNGYTGIAWSIGGVHDRPWRERAIFGTVRYMNYNGAKRKFNVEEYIQQITDAIKELPA